MVILYARSKYYQQYQNTVPWNNFFNGNLKIPWHGQNPKDSTVWSRNSYTSTWVSVYTYIQKGQDGQLLLFHLVQKREFPINSPKDKLVRFALTATSEPLEDVFHTKSEATEGELHRENEFLHERSVIRAHYHVMICICVSFQLEKIK